MPQSVEARTVVLKAACTMGLVLCVEVTVPVVACGVTAIPGTAGRSKCWHRG